MAEEGVEVLSTPQAVKSKDPNQPLTYRYWTRPTHLQYKYLYNYRYNYYDDVIDYLDKRSKGLTREIPRPQTWAERALRSFSSRSETYSDRHKDWELLNTIRASNNYYHYHSRDYITKRGSGFNNVSDLSLDTMYQSTGDWSGPKPTSLGQTGSDQLAPSLLARKWEGW
uniref:Flightin n=1 Tax=Timema genevievae TaxID=629358 RepID=A0A7R9JY56_TIMGE|nr:unnamed protein product [Timema genevievae]